MKLRVSRIQEKRLEGRREFSGELCGQPAQALTARHRDLHCTKLREGDFGVLYRHPPTSSEAARCGSGCGTHDGLCAIHGGIPGATRLSSTVTRVTRCRAERP